MNQHLQYTHGEGLVLAVANQVRRAATPSSPSRTCRRVLRWVSQNHPAGGVLRAATTGLRGGRHPAVRAGLPAANGNDVETHYAGSGGVRLNSFLTKAAFAIRFGDFNLLISNLVTAKSRIIFVRDVQQMATKAAPFLHFDADPYAAVVNGHIDWILDAYTTTDQYPYSENADNAQVPPTAG